MTTSPKMFTIFRRTCTGLLDEDNNKIGTEERVTHHTLPGRDAQSATEDLIENFADDDPSLEGFDPDDDEYEFLRMVAIDNVVGVFSAYEGELTERPETPPLYEDGEIGAPYYWQRVPKEDPTARKPLNEEEDEDYAMDTSWVDISDYEPGGQFDPLTD